MKSEYKTPVTEITFFESEDIMVASSALQDEGDIESFDINLT